MHTGSRVADLPNGAEIVQHLPELLSDDPRVAELAALRVHALMPLPGSPEHPSSALLDHIEHREAALRSVTKRGD
ncbi:hypothetical protein [Ruania halotolerans]|uniref:hypothetical protein n=1 Tax=Ruania halotolerans TaxID=2897773 RepID=UPI001E51666C|nr:hypothetical protein [Ruania halotolerans]UFU06996.1 hypothetical protein LQF10_02480 [Ruania halotolerans]